MSRRPVITIDGPAGAGKSTVARILARQLSYRYLDTGSLYRAVAYHLRKNHWNGSNEGLTSICTTMDISLVEDDGAFGLLLNGRLLKDEIRTEEISQFASTVSAIPMVREVLLGVQRKVAQGGGVVAEGRDMGTVVFPDAEFKFFLDASIAERASRRTQELHQRGGSPSYEAIREGIRLRDQQDQERSIAPLSIPHGAITIDSTDKTINEVVDAMLGFILKVP